MHLSLRQLEVFRQFARTASVTETAGLMRVSQPAISQTLKEVEGQLGFALFNRIGGRTHLTSEALELLPEVDRLIAQFTTLRGLATELRDGSAGKLAIAGVSTLYAGLLPRALARFRQEHAKVQIRAEIHVAQEVVRQVRQDEADVGFAFLPMNQAAVLVRPVARMRVVCAVPVGHPLARRRSVSTRDLNQYEVIVQNAGTSPGSVLHHSLDSDAGFTARVLDTNHSIPALQMVRNGLGIALIHPLTFAAVPEAWSTVRCIPFEPAISQTLAMVLPALRPVPRSVQHFEAHFLHTLRALCDELGKMGLICRLLD